MSLEVRRLTKSFAGTKALRHVDLRVDDGTVHALLGHNGAGKSTLIRCLGGAFAPDSGEMVLGGRGYRRLEPRQSIAAGVAIIYQHLSLVDSLTVADNLFLGRERRRAGFVLTGRQEREASEMLSKVGATCSPRALVADLPMAQRQLVEIAKAVSRDPQILVLDEPTAALSAREAAALAERVSELRRQGLAILYITHLLAEVERLADHVTVLRDGAVVFQRPMTGVSRRDLVRAIAGTGLTGARPDPVIPGQARLRIDEVRGVGFGPVSLRVRAGEVVALHGLVGSGRTRLVETLAGRRQLTSGRIIVDDTPLPAGRPRRVIEAGVALVPADRARQALFADMSAADNTLMSSFGLLGRYGLRRRGAERRTFRAASSSVGLRPPVADAPAASFSGGNQQKLVLGRWITGVRRLRVLLLDEPTQGVDVGAREEIYRVVRALARDTGCAVLVSSADPEEVVALADRCVVMAAGRFVAELGPSDITQARLLELTHQSGDPVSGGHA
ncbi:MAG: sugar ABC transporter ATP-binding protein [Micromonosporaceae bacterium]